VISFTNLLSEDRNLFKRIDHVEFITMDIEKTLDFYTGVLGFSIKRRQQPRPGSPFKEIVFLTLGNTMLEVLVVPDATPAEDGPPRVAYRMMALEVEDMEKAVNFLKSRGIELTRPLMDMGNAKRGEIKDPNGLSIELRWWA
jgi:glyoxylase I family protein